MMWPRTYYQTFKKSLTNLNFFREVLEKPFSFTLRYFVMTVLLASLISGYIFISRQLPVIEAEIDRSFELAVQYFPKDLEINWDGQSLSSTDQFELSYPESMPAQEYGLPEKMALFLTGQDKVDPQELENEALVVVTAQQVYLANGLGQYQNFDIDQVFFEDEFSLNQKNAQDQLARIKTEYLQPFWTTVLVIGALMAPLLLFLSRLLTLVIESALLFVLLRINGLKLGFKKTLQLAFYFYAPAEAIHLLAQLTAPNFQTPMLSISFWLFALYVIFNLGKKLEKPLPSHSKQKKS